MERFDVIVVGCGAMGSAALHHLAQRGARVFGLEQFGIAHDRGSSHGQTRIIRKAYFEHPAYVPLLHRAYDLWRQLETDSGWRLFERTGLLELGRPEGALIPGILRSAAEHRLPIERVPIEQVSSRFPGFAIGDLSHAVFEVDAGFLRVELCVAALIDQARRRGAIVRINEPAESWSANEREAIVSTSAGRYAAKKLVFCGGPWAGRMLSDVGLPLEVRRKVQLWFACDDERYRFESGFPVFAYDLPDGFFYGFPVLNAPSAPAEAGMREMQSATSPHPVVQSSALLPPFFAPPVEPCLKIAEHTGRQIVGDPSTVDRDLHEEDVQRVARFVRNHLPGVQPRVVHHSVCMYTMTPDEHFIVDRHPQHANVFFAAGFSGHGFKFAPLIGSVLADLALDGATDEPVEFLRLSRLL